MSGGMNVTFWYTYLRPLYDLRYELEPTPEHGRPGIGHCLALGHAVLADLDLYSDGIALAVDAPKPCWS